MIQVIQIVKQQQETRNDWYKTPANKGNLDKKPLIQMDSAKKNKKKLTPQQNNNKQKQQQQTNRQKQILDEQREYLQKSLNCNAQAAHVFATAK